MQGRCTCLKTREDVDILHLLMIQTPEHLHLPVFILHHCKVEHYLFVSYHVTGKVEALFGGSASRGDSSVTWRRIIKLLFIQDSYCSGLRTSSDLVKDHMYGCVLNYARA